MFGHGIIFDLTIQLNMYLRAFALILMGIFYASLSHAQAASNEKANPVSYDNVLWSGHVAQFSFLDLGERKVLGAKKMSFFAPKRVEMNFRVKIKPDGRVAYVSPPRCSSEEYEYRKGGASALYGYEFSPVPEGTGDQWVNVEMTVGE